MAYLLLKNRDDCSMGLNDPKKKKRSGLPFPVDQDDLQAVLRKLAHIKRKVMDGDPPLPEHIASSTDCKYCSYKYLCHDATRRARQKHEPVIKYPDPKVNVQHVVAKEESDGTDTG